MPLSSEQEIAVFQRAKELLEPEGAWMQDSYCNVKPVKAGSTLEELLPQASCFCTLGAVRRAILDLKMPVSGFNFEIVVADRFGLGRNDRLAVADWNDEEGRTKGQVLAKLDEIVADLTTKD